MARIRTIKPDFGQHDKLSALPAETHLIAALLLPYADDYGYFNAHPKLVHAAICPLRELSRGIPEHLRSLQEIGYLELSTGKDGRLYGKISNFLTHQVVSHKSKSKIEAQWNPPEGLQNTPEPLQPEGEGEREVEGEEIPEQQPPLNCARRLMEIVSLTQSAGFLRTVEAAIVAESGFLGVSAAEAAEQIAKHAMRARQNGASIDKFYFEDTKWRNGNGNGTKQSKPPAAIARSERLQDAITAGVGADLRRRVETHSPERQDRPRRVLGN